MDRSIDGLAPLNLALPVLGERFPGLGLVLFTSVQAARHDVSKIPFLSAPRYLALAYLLPNAPTYSLITSTRSFSLALASSTTCV
jgi:hypothetical protein